MRCGIAWRGGARERSVLAHKHRFGTVLKSLTRITWIDADLSVAGKLACPRRATLSSRASARDLVCASRGNPATITATWIPRRFAPRDDNHPEVILPVLARCGYANV